MNIIPFKPKKSTWTLFWDMHSGGGSKEQWDKIIIEASEAEAVVIFYNRFGHNPFRVSCTCCGEDYSVGESQDETLEQVTGFHRDAFLNDDNRYEERSAGRSYSKYQTLDEYLARPDVLVICADEIKPEERRGSVPTQGYTWID